MYISISIGICAYAQSVYRVCTYVHIYIYMKSKSMTLSNGCQWQQTRSHAVELFLSRHAALHIQMQSIYAFLACRTAMILTCVSQPLRRVTSTLVRAMDPDPVNHLFGVSENFRSTELLSRNQIDMRLTGFLGACLPRIITIIIRQWNGTSLLYCTYQLLRRARCKCVRMQ